MIHVATFKEHYCYLLRPPENTKPNQLESIIGLGSRAQGLGFRGWGLGLGLSVQGPGVRDWGVRSRGQVADIKIYFTPLTHPYLTGRKYFRP